MLPQLKFFSSLGLSFCGLGSSTSHNLHDICRKSPSASRTKGKRAKGRRQEHPRRPEGGALRAVAASCSAHLRDLVHLHFTVSLWCWTLGRMFRKELPVQSKGCPKLDINPSTITRITPMWRVEREPTHKHLNQLWQGHFDVCFSIKIILTCTDYFMFLFTHCFMYLLLLFFPRQGFSLKLWLS